MRMIRKLIILFIITGCCFTNCINEPTDTEFEEEIIVRAYLYTGSSIDSVHISKSIKIGEIYSPGEAAVTGAGVSISVDNVSYQLSEYGDKPGVYYLPLNYIRVTPGKTYHLEAQVGDKLISASTTAPDFVQIVRVNLPETEYLGKPFEVFWRGGEGAAGYILSVKARSSAELVELSSFMEHALEETEFDTTEFFPPVNNFPVQIHESNFQIPWPMFWYYGDYTLTIYAVDKNFFDFSTSFTVLEAQSSFYEKPPSHIQGGIGIFAALSRASEWVKVKRETKKEKP